MTRDEFALLLKQFAERPMPATSGRHVYLWTGTPEQLTALAPRGLFTGLDLHRLCKSLDRTPQTPEAAKKTLADAIEKWLETKFPSDPPQRALAVTGCDLLTRYTVPLGLFMRLASEKRLVAWVIPSEINRFKPSQPLPAYVRLQPQATLDYFKSQMADEAIIGE